MRLPEKQHGELRGEFSSSKRRKFEHSPKSVASKALDRPTQASSSVGTQSNSPVKHNKKTSISRSATTLDVPRNTRVEKEEDAYIAYLESKLGKYRGKMNDGLDGVSFFQHLGII
jgi:hypothetical protein